MKKLIILFCILSVPFYNMYAKSQTEKIDIKAPQMYVQEMEEDKPCYKLALLWLTEVVSSENYDMDSYRVFFADSLVDVLDSYKPGFTIDFKDEELQIIKGTSNVKKGLSPWWFDYKIKIEGKKVTISFSNFKVGTKKVKIFTTMEYNNFKEITSALASSLFAYIENF